MAATRAEQIRLFNWALARVRAARNPHAWTGQHDVGELTQQGYRALKDTVPTMHQADMKNAVLRAIAANDLGREMTERARELLTNPNARDNPLAREYPHRPVLDARRGRYEYRVVVRGTSGRRSIEEVVTIQSRTRLAGHEVIDQAREVFEETTANWDRTRTTDPVLRGTVRTEGFIISAIHSLASRENR